MPRTPPPRTSAQQRIFDRLAALRSGTPEAVRAWAKQYEVPLINPEDDEALLITIHEARIAEGIGRATSKRWLKDNRARIIAAREKGAANGN